MIIVQIRVQVRVQVYVQSDVGVLVHIHVCIQENVISAQIFAKAAAMEVAMVHANQNKKRKTQYK